MSGVDQTTLQQLWRSAPVGRLSAWEVAKALGLREASKELHDGQTNEAWVAERVSKIGGGHPSKQALHEPHSACIQKIHGHTDGR